MVTLLALHGASRDETDLVAFSRRVAPDAALIAPRGAFPVGDGYSFFRRQPDGGIDAAELISTAEGWLSQESESLLPVPGKIVLIGYSSGAIFAEALLAVRPDRFAGAILLRPQPLAGSFVFPDMPGKPIVVLAGRHDERRRPDAATRLVAQLEAAGAEVTLHLLDCGHGWEPNDEDARIAQSWLSRVSIG
jgi:phospholipase/carboxylesterase